LIEKLEKEIPKKKKEKKEGQVIDFPESRTLLQYNFHIKKGAEAAKTYRT
jgi:hypothetical protein